jgi:hypothetical protein
VRAFPELRRNPTPWGEPRGLQALGRGIGESRIAQWPLLPRGEFGSFVMPRGVRLKHAAFLGE